MPCRNGKDPADSSNSARQGHNTKSFDSPFKVDPTTDGKRDDPVWHFIARGRYLDGSTAAGRKSGRRCMCRLCGRSMCRGAKAAKEHFSKSENFRCEVATPAVWYAIWSKDMTKCTKEFVSAIEALQSLSHGHPNFQWPPLRYPEHSVPPLDSATAPLETVPSSSPAVRVTVVAAGHIAMMGKLEPSRVAADARQPASLVGEQAMPGLGASEVPIPVSDSSPTPLPPTTGVASAAPHVLTGSLDPLYRMRDIAAAQSATPESPGGLLDVGILGGPATTGRGRGTFRQQAVTSYYSDPLEHAWHLQIMRFIVESGMTFNCVKLESFKRMFAMIIPPRVPGAPTPKVPTYHMVRTSLLDELDAEVQKCVRPLLDTAREFGCTIITDGWTNIRGQTLCNYLVGTNLGAAYVATDVMHGKKDATALATAWLKRVKSMDMDLSDITAFIPTTGGAVADRGTVQCRSGRVEKRRGDVVIYHDDSSTAAEAGETTGAGDPVAATPARAAAAALRAATTAALAASPAVAAAVTYNDTGGAGTTTALAASPAVAVAAAHIADAAADASATPPAVAASGPAARAADAAAGPAASSAAAKGRFLESSLEGHETLRLIPSNGEVPDSERVEGGRSTVSGEFVWVESKEVEGRGLGRSLEVTAVIFLAPEAWAKIIVPLVLGQGGGLGRLLRDAREARGEWISRVRERFTFVAIEKERFAGEGELPRAHYPLTVRVPSFLFAGANEGKIVRLLERGRCLGLPFGALWTLYTHCIDQGVPPRRKLLGNF
ncbi:hypothetical protein CBR_g40479 [Chara braunii]|uniref:DUF659 domain-containing protein n=1 Tax=Chara braunii TaxID=69332 RepID=A0A388LTV7_CHABU|nr:hypothetical protein CBR_g40479 [Chara braunii]|eukprot:GBG85750.1 hypothetical protein CBR_g40479 [Chara braunii]